MYAARILHHFGTPEGAYFAGREELQACPGLPEKVRQALEDKDLSQADQILAQCEALGIWVLTCQDAAYPQRLGQLDSAPCVLYGRGRLPQMDQEAAVALVGARQASPYGIMAAGRLGLDLARQGALVVSGMAQGVDAAALRGALLSEYPPGTPPTGPHFPVRNRLIAGLSLGVLVVEGSQTSGALITARWALEQGRDVFAVPGGIDAPLSQGPNGLIRRGEAKLIQDAWDVVEEYAALYPDKLHPKTPLAPGAARARLEGRESPPPVPPQQKEPAPARLVVDLGKDPEALTDDQAALLRALQARGEQSADDLVEATGIPARRVLSALTLLQVRQWVAEAGRRFTTLVELKEDRTHPPRG